MYVALGRWNFTRSGARLARILPKNMRDSRGITQASAQLRSVPSRSVHQKVQLCEARYVKLVHTFKFDLQTKRMWLWLGSTAVQTKTRAKNVVRIAFLLTVNAGFQRVCLMITDNRVHAPGIRSFPTIQMHYNGAMETQ